MTRFRLFALIVLPILVQASVWGQTPPAQAERPSEQVDKLFEKMDRTISPGCAVAAMKDAKILYERGYGMADLDHNVLITPATVFHVASMSKQFAAASIVMLAQEGKLSLDDEVRKYVPELPDFGVPITIRQLVHHTSSLRDLSFTRIQSPRSLWSFHAEPVLQIGSDYSTAQEITKAKGGSSLGRIKWATRRVGGACLGEIRAAGEVDWLGGTPFVPVMEAANLSKLNHRPLFRRLHPSRQGRIFGQRQVSP